MTADMNIRCMIELFFHHFIIICGRFCRKYTFQSACPCFFRFCQSNFGIRINKFLLFENLTDHRVCNAQFSHFVCRNFCNNISKCRRKQFSRIQIMLDLHTQFISKCHLTCRSDYTMTIQRICGNNLSTVDICCKFAILIHQLCINREIILIFFNLHPNQFISWLFQFRSNNLILCCHVYGKRYKSRRNINILECSRHTVFPPDRRKPESKLCFICTQECCKRLTPSLRIFCHTTEIFLECKTNLAIISTCGYDLRNWLYHCINRSMIRTPAWQIWIKSVAHHRNRICCSIHNRNFCNHSLCLCHLILTTVRHKHGTCSDGAVEHLYQTFLRAYI